MAVMPSRPGLAELIDLESGLLDLQQHRASAAAAGRELCEQRGIGAAQARQRAESDPAWRWSLAAAWLRRLRAGGTLLPGETVTRSLRTASRLLQLLGILLGAAAASATLAYDGTAPVNLWNFLGVFVLLQILLFAILLLSLGAGAARGKAVLSATQRALGGIARAALTRRLLGYAPESWRASWSNLAEQQTALASRRPLYRDAERWILFRSAQAIGVGFHLAAAIVFLWLALFSDLAFAWSTTPAKIDAGWLHGLVEALAVPWSWLAASSVPSAAEVAATQWNRLEGRFVGTDPDAAAAASAAWWSFLLLAQLCWGLLPRLLAWLWADRKSQRALALAPLDHAGFHALFDAMLVGTHAPSWQGPAPESVRGDLIDEHKLAAIDASSQDRPRPAAALIWGGFPADATELATQLAARFAWRLGASLPAGGSDAAQTEQNLKQCAADARAAAGKQSTAQGKALPAAVVLFVESEASPNKALLRALSSLRGELGPDAALLVALVGSADAQQLAIWRGYLGRSRDPYLRIEALA
jgi:hypothetical protein